MWSLQPKQKQSANLMKQAPSFWEKRHWKAWLLWPLSLLFFGITQLRLIAFELGLLKSKSLPVPVIIIGNIRVGGTGKTPIVIAMAQALYERGFKPGVISRGYSLNSRDSKNALEVDDHSDVNVVGDEPLVIHHYLRSLNIPIWIGANRVACAEQLLKHHANCDVILSDDGLQHYQLKRDPAREGGHDIEIVVQDARGTGNGFMLPAGPLRESTHRERDITLQTGLGIPSANEAFIGSDELPSTLFHVDVAIGKPYQLINPSNKQELLAFSNQQVLAAAGLGDPRKFFKLLASKGLHCDTLALPDHYSYHSNPFSTGINRQYSKILITEKDAVKCQSFGDERIWVVPLAAKLPSSCIDWIEAVLHRNTKA